ncbi:HAAS signaling domain-containing protein [Streptomyces sp. NPDC006879]|uniref:HAAS signaling domain-containing protein n=1 Tax=Streptomyces sp. NPDC006879 TaxID=3364767 RepID=UPI0036A6D87A
MRVGIESDRLVFDYLSRVGDLAQRSQLPSSDRMRLVAELREEIDRQRARYATDTPAAVQRILNRLGTPEAVLGSAASGGPSGPGTSGSQGDAVVVPIQRDRRRWRKGVTGGADRSAQARPPDQAVPSDLEVPAVDVAPSRPAPTPPHLAGEDELGSGRVEPDWWRMGPAPSFTPFGAGDDIGGFVGGIEDPELLGRSRRSGPWRPPEEADSEPSAAVSKPDEGLPPSASGVLARLRRRGAAAKSEDEAVEEEAPAAVRPRPHVLLLLAAAVLVVGALTRSLLLLALGWLMAYGSRTLSPAERKWVALGLPGVVLLGAAVWLWGRAEGRWGEPLATGGVAAAFGELWPVLVPLAALASAAHLVWRARRR